LGEDVVEGDVAHHGTKRRRRVLARAAKSATCTTLASASTTLKKVMKSIAISALSLVIAVCFGISR
jgi:hypothetical protein